MRSRSSCGIATARRASSETIMTLRRSRRRSSPSTRPRIASTVELPPSDSMLSSSESRSPRRQAFRKSTLVLTTGTP